MTNSTSDTIAAVATPPGPGGISIVRISGPDACRVTKRFARFHERINDPCPRVAHRVDVVDPVAPNAQVDNGLLLFMPGPNSYTGEDVIEFQGHGGPLVTNSVLEVVLNAGARPADPGEFTLRAFLNGRLDLAQAEAVADVVAAPTAEALAASAFIIGKEEMCFDLLAKFNWGHTFLELNENLLKDYQKAKSEDDIHSIIIDYGYDYN